jgi:hypothetical protein
MAGKRRQYFVDPKVQGGIAIRCVVYWATCLLTTFVFLFSWSYLRGNSQFDWETANRLWIRYGAVAIASALLLPFIVWDVIKLTNRFAGPMFRLRREMKKLAAGEAVNPLFFRHGDYWQEMADDFNRLVVRIRELEAKDAHTTRQAIQDLAAKDELLAAENAR